MILVVLDNQNTKNEVTKICNEPGISWTGKELKFLTVQILGQIWTIDWRWSEALSVKSALTLSFKIIAFLIAHCVIRYFATKLAFSHNFIYSPTKGQVPWAKILTFKMLLRIGDETFSNFFCRFLNHNYFWILIVLVY